MAKHTIQLVVKDPVALEAALFPVFAAGMREGRDFRMPHVKADDPKPKQSRSAIVRYAIERGIRACLAEDSQGVTALPEKAGTADADRLRAAMGEMAPIEVCRAAGLADGASIRNVVNKGAPLRGRLLAWVEMREKEVGT